MKIVIAYDGAEAAKRALERVAELGGGGKVSVVSAVHVLPQFGRAPLTIDLEEIAERTSEPKEAAEILSAKDIQPSLYVTGVRPWLRHWGSTPTEPRGCDR